VEWVFRTWSCPIDQFLAEADSATDSSGEIARRLTDRDPGWCLDAVMSDPVELVLAYVEAAQRARTSGSPDDFEAIRAYLADQVEIRLASPWTDEPWRTAHTGADAVVDQLRSRANAGARLTTETVNAVAAGGDVLIEQVSTLHTDEGDKVSCVAHVVTVVDNRIARIRTYRNDAGLPTG